MLEEPAILRIKLHMKRILALIILLLARFVVESNIISAYEPSLDMVALTIRGGKAAVDFGFTTATDVDIEGPYSVEC